MPTIIDKSIFTGKLFIPNVQTVPDIHNGTQPNNQDKLTATIEKYERLLLVNALGFEQYDLLIANLDATDGKWFNLINGVTYNNRRFDGLKQIIAHYVYFAFLRYESVHFDTTGLERSDAANSTSVSPVERLVDIWNTFVSMYQYYHGCGCLFYGEYTPNFVSLYTFLYDNKEEYSITNFGFYSNQNVYGIC